MAAGLLAAQLLGQAPSQSGSAETRTTLQTTAEWNQRLAQWAYASAPAGDYRLGPDDLLEITVFEAKELDRTVRITSGGDISLPLLGEVQAAGLTPRQLEAALEELLRRTYMKDPHVSVFVREMVSHGVSVFGAVRRPGVVQIQGTRTLLEILSMVEGLENDAGDTVLVMPNAALRTARPRASVPDEGSALLSREGSASDATAIEVDLKKLLESGDPRYNVPVHPGDIVKVTRAGIVYVVGEVRKPGGFVLRNNENISALQAIALGEGLTRTAARGSARIIRTDPGSGERTEIALDLGKVLAGKEPDPLLQPKDIVFVPNSTTRSVLYRSGEAAVSIVSGLIIWRR